MPYKMAKIQIASDLHLEFLENRRWLEKNPLIPAGEILLLAGDIVPDKYKKMAGKFYARASADFPTIISTMGNHEFYHGSISYAYPSYSGKISHNHVKLNNKSLTAGNIKFIVSVLWSFILPGEKAAVESGMNDFRLIREKDAHGEKVPITAGYIRKLHQLSLGFLKEEIEKPFPGKIVVMTHHLPSYTCISKQYARSRINSGYATHLDAFVKSHPQIALWVHGHSHGFSDLTIGSTRIVRNALGYVDWGEHREFKRDFVVEV